MHNMQSQYGYAVLLEAGLPHAGLDTPYEGHSPGSMNTYADPLSNRTLAAVAWTTQHVYVF